MAGSTFGTLFTITTWGNPMVRHSVLLSMDARQAFPLSVIIYRHSLTAGNPDKSKFTTARKESDSVEFFRVSLKGYTTGTPISLIVRNTDQRSHDYSKRSKTVTAPDMLIIR